MIDCTKTTNYFTEKLRMTKRTKNGLCKIKCSNCPLCSNNNGKGLSCPTFEMYYPRRLRLYRGGAMNIRQRHFLRSFWRSIRMQSLITEYQRFV